jgi:regulator of nucleoside diphosphate kinase
MNKIYVTQKDHQRLHELVMRQRSSNGNSKYAMQLGIELKRACQVQAEDILECVVTMNSRVRLREMKTNKMFEITLVYPQDVNINERKVSILAPVGIAILGCKEGDLVELPVPTGSTISYVIEKVIYQPEAAGDFHL